MDGGLRPAGGSALALSKAVAVFPAEGVFHAKATASREDAEDKDTGPNPFLVRLEQRVRALGDLPAAVKARIRGDNALGRQEFGDSDLIHWR